MPLGPASPTLARIRTENEGPPATVEQVSAVERGLRVAFPRWLRELYLACDGFNGPTGVGYFFPLTGEGSVANQNLFLRAQEWAPPWLDRAVLFGTGAAGGSITVFWGALGGDLIEWCIGDGHEYTRLDGDVFDLWRREQAQWDGLR